MHEGHKQYTENIIFRQKREKVRPFLKDTTKYVPRQLPYIYNICTIVQCTYYYELINGVLPDDTSVIFPNQNIQSMEPFAH